MKSPTLRTGRLLPAGAAALLLLLLAACDRPSPGSGAPAPDQVSQVDPSRIGGAMPPSGAAPDAAVDERLSVAVGEALAREPGLSDQSIEIEVQSGLVTLRGRVADAALREKALQAVGAVDGVLGVQDRIVVLQKP
jgi:hypothetical protein